jgi:hypothetical protein
MVLDGYRQWSRIGERLHSTTGGTVRAQKLIARASWVPSFHDHPFGSRLPRRYLLIAQNWKTGFLRKLDSPLRMFSQPLHQAQAVPGMARARQFRPAVQQVRGHQPLETASLAANFAPAIPAA